MSISESLGEQREVALPQGTVRYRERGEGEPIVFIHGLLVNGDLWRKVVPELAGSFRCITPDLPLGSHSLPLSPTADLTPTGLAQLIADFLYALDLDAVTVVGNDTGTALTQILCTRHPARIGRMVLTTGDAFNNFPPRLFKPIVAALGYTPGALWVTSKLTKPRRIQRAALGPLARKVPGDEILDSFLAPGSDAGVRRDVAKVLRGLRSRYTLEAAEQLRDLRAPTLLVWAPEDRFFPNEHADRLAELIPDARVEHISDSYAFSSEDQPEKLAELIAGFVAERPLGAAKPRAAAGG